MQAFIRLKIRYGSVEVWVVGQTIVTDVVLCEHEAVASHAK